MDIEARIKRRRRRDGEPRLIQDHTALSPVAHIEEPADRGPVLEQLLDHFEPVFEGHLPANGYVYGPSGSGKSAVVTALVAHLNKLPAKQPVIHTSTRAQSKLSPSFAYLDARTATSEFAFYHELLDGLVDETVPRQGIGTATLKSRLGERLEGTPGVVVVVDHACEQGTIDGTELVDRIEALPSNVRWLAVGRHGPEETSLAEYVYEVVRVEPYRQQMLVDVLMTRASDGIAQRALDHGLARRIAEWADGNAHDALAALLVAASLADREGQTRVSEAEVDAAIREMPTPRISLGRLLSLPANRQAVLRELIDLDEDERASVTATTEAIGASPAVDLSPGTVKRFLYEMAESGIVERVESQATNQQGRPPSRVEPRFPPTAFRLLYDMGTG